MSPKYVLKKVYTSKVIVILLVKRLQSFGPSNFDDDPIIWDSRLGHPRVVHGWPSGRLFFLATSFEGL